MPDTPPSYDAFKARYPAVWEAYDRLGSAVHSQGTLDSKTRQLVKLGLAIGFRSEGAVHSHTRKALAAGAARDEIRQVALLAITTIGFPAGMAAMSWIEDVLGEATEP